VAESRLPGDTNLLPVDQFEKPFRFRREGGGPERANDADAFVHLLPEAARPAHAAAGACSAIYVVLTLRSDFLGDCALFYGLPEAINCSIIIGSGSIHTEFLGDDRRTEDCNGMQPLNLTFLRNLSRSSQVKVAAVADNCRFDERASNDRWQRFEDLVGNPSTADWRDWGEANNLYLERYCQVPSLSVPDAFLDINRSAWLAATKNQDVIRFELLLRPLRAFGGGLDDLGKLFNRADAGDADSIQAAEQFFEVWNQRRDGRPAFAAFYDEVQEEVNGDDWPHALRDRLGLGFFGRTGGAALPMALMRYSLSDVIATQTARGLPTACALPTVLDGGMHEFFFPVPREHPFGATLHLNPDLADMLTAEIIHCRIDYKREHLWKLGFIERPHGLSEDRLRAGRDLHLLALREECDRDDFGEMMEERT
jgi:hypothetical protein